DAVNVTGPEHTLRARRRSRAPASGGACRSGPLAPDAVGAQPQHRQLLVDPQPQRRRRLLLAAAAHQLLEHHLELLLLEARGALLEVRGDPLLVELTELGVDVLPQPPDGLVALARRT